MFYNGNEVRRSYADGLLGVEGNVITFNPPFKHDKDKVQLMPFLQEERQSGVENKASRSASELNLEIMPVLDRVVISNVNSNKNKNAQSSASSSKEVSLHQNKRLRVGEWNAERGLNWDIFEVFCPGADIIILNEMDWGMTRSLNIDTTKHMADMNYAYGVEFMELTNGNLAEINATMGEANNIIG
jgi:hypothetical protein